MATNFPAVLAAAAAGFLVGWIWYSIFGGAWRAGLGPSAPRSTPILLVLAAIANLVMAAMLSGVLFHTGLWTWHGGMISGALLWTGFVLTTVGVSESFQNRPPSVIAIDVGHWLFVLLAMGTILGTFGQPG
ncbi:DUF1761 domain-containing protein [Methyloligella sp. 2.7D]|uniref:DUF1761 domain-containing protein n=1 Tax=unclassified Methyloligella TaxID=2625955 RepID=UPI00157D6C17|nr:DUF1761 domain-containing protein [Methyloligella sp. GL2]QKP76187.1 DUF1761 domain-containing protein [Methyloligella sp. GL2]